jgi:pimeloyl-ACP methyl ester carboxylesterase
VLVGQSFGGLYVRMYAARFPKEVEGMVLVDASHPDMWTRLPPEVVATLKPPNWQVSAMTFPTLLSGDLGGRALRYRLQASETVISTCSAISGQVRPWSRSSRICCVEAG